MFCAGPTRWPRRSCARLAACSVSSSFCFVRRRVISPQRARLTWRRSQSCAPVAPPRHRAAAHTISARWNTRGRRERRDGQDNLLPSADEAPEPNTQCRRASTLIREKRHAHHVGRQQVVYTRTRDIRACRKGLASMHVTIEWPAAPPPAPACGRSCGMPSMGAAQPQPWPWSAACIFHRPTPIPRARLACIIAGPGLLCPSASTQLICEGEARA